MKAEFKVSLIFIVALALTFLVPKVSHAEVFTSCDNQGCHQVIVIRDANGNILYVSRS